MKKKMIIVGAGISGLSTGYFAQLNGFDTTIFEMQKIPGGLCTSWTRKGYTFDTSMHFLMSSKQGPLRKLWDELGITPEQEFHYHDRAVFVEGKDKALDICMDRQQLEQQMKAISSQDSALIDEYLDLYFGENPMSGMPLDQPEVMGLFRKVKLISSMMSMFRKSKKYAKMSLQDFAARFKDPFLSRAIRYQIDSPGWAMPGFPLLFMTGGATSTVRDSGYPLGGSKKVVFGIAERFEKLGGKFRYKTRVTDVIVEKKKAVGIQLEDGSIEKADIVVWCADGHHLHFDILKEKHMNRKTRKMYREWTPVSPIVQVLFGVDMDLSGEPHCIIHETGHPVTVGNKEFEWLHIMSHCFDKSTAPAGKSALEVWYITDYEYWKNLSSDRGKYEMEKKRIAEQTADALEAKWPGFKAKIEMVDVTSPMTYERYTGNWLGSPDGWYLTVDNFMDQNMKKTFPGLKNLYMVSQWGAPYTGTVSTSLGGRQLIQILCKKYRQKFQATAA
jgi:phytoene dehydrogenase-like protein